MIDGNAKRNCEGGFWTLEFTFFVRVFVKRTRNKVWKPDSFLVDVCSNDQERFFPVTLYFYPNLSAACTPEVAHMHMLNCSLVWCPWCWCHHHYHRHWHFQTEPTINKNTTITTTLIRLKRTFSLMNIEARTLCKHKVQCLAKLTGCVKQLSHFLVKLFLNLCTTEDWASEKYNIPHKQQQRQDTCHLVEVMWLYMRH